MKPKFKKAFNLIAFGLLALMVLALGIGVSGAFAYNAAFPANTTTTAQQTDRQEWNVQYWRGYPGGRMMDPWGSRNGQFGPWSGQPGQSPQADQDDSSTSN